MTICEHLDGRVSIVYGPQQHCRLPRGTTTGVSRALSPYDCITDCWCAADNFRRWLELIYFETNNRGGP
jgi:hypothetical protein